MLKIKTTNDKLLGPLQQVTGIVERRHTLPILSNVLLTAGGGKVNFLATDLEVQITSTADLEGNAEGTITAGARKLFDILRSLPEDGRGEGRLQDPHPAAEGASPGAAARAVRHGGAGHPLLPERRAVLRRQGHASRGGDRRPPALLREPPTRRRPRNRRGDPAEE